MRTPASTYRLQLNAEFTLYDAAEIMPYLAGLGVDWVYLSPILQSKTGSTHGYDVVDPTRVDESRGGRRGLEALSKAAHDAGLGVLVDIVPNHVGIEVPRENPWWWDVLQHGQESKYAKFFDIDWDHGGGRVLIPVIGDDDMPPSPGDPIGGLWIDRGAGVVRYYDHEYPLAPGTADNEDDDPRTVLRRQHYKLAHWREGDFALNYRRFFTVTTLAGVRVEDDEVWEDAHAEILSWVRDGLVDGLRIDHPDGLRDPEGYLAKLRDRTDGIYVTVEKILEPGEDLPDWSCDGTTGYDALGEYERVIVDATAVQVLDESTSALSHTDIDDWPTLVHKMKRFVTDGPLQAEIRWVAREIARSGVQIDRAEDALSEIAASFAVYRTYLPTGRDQLDRAARDAADWREDLAAQIEQVYALLADPTHPAAKRFQQVTGMVMAKGVEDRAFYRYSRLTSLNEVGGDPSLFSIDLRTFHALQQRRLEWWPAAQTALSTHDTKRSEDVRARIDVLSELPEQWHDLLEQLLEIAPIRNHSFANLLWQAVIGVWPARRERLHEYALKAAREAGDHTTWTEVDEDYEAELLTAVDTAFDHPAVRSLINNFLDLVRVPGWTNSLVLKTMQLLAPGVPDVYQGSELWNFSLVDPDNRRAVRWDSRRTALDAVNRGARPEIDESGAAKLMVTTAALRIRKHFAERLNRYEPLYATGAGRDHVIAFNRGGMAFVGMRRPVGLEAGGGWHDTKLAIPEGTWVDQLSGRQFAGSVPLGALLSELPVAILLRS
ncbi:malto-oligosyltrehalose synthase [Gulosibacter molinativorax]|uniref:Malto-oligosyltrehalose synthase n=1 Tax=Gulosibacter molinativorax TaxID=256821 RepID=A0ABT7C9G9_9MICO|nr:malto-oligosyltrehalose synthase [Gulosibacter molinativorax]MDJ1371840.1 malto-oligosyltrehalose synthase [Gulosibacter molinativorax]QUY60788.1 Maltooligosyltrehalose synthase [Gulosibacter molinativorax]